MTEREAWIEGQVELIGAALPKLEAAQMLRDAMAFATEECAKVCDKYADVKHCKADSAAMNGAWHREAAGKNLAAAIRKLNTPAASEEER